ncbi:hypothetical protein MCNF_13580 [Mycolicibacterium confluentis]|uniref:Uncharacterized protein n=1 Tax=Mycolicibacterium confluentis TaxID=28047 RepID=A0A7I7XUK9_9MYCO|nr:hypothetical protein MCNF_13580 [Mycolicibacterium confluentis]
MITTAAKLSTSPSELTVSVVRVCPMISVSVVTSSPISRAVSFRQYPLRVAGKLAAAVRENAKWTSLTAVGAEDERFNVPQNVPMIRRPRR